MLLLIQLMHMFKHIPSKKATGVVLMLMFGIAATAFLPGMLEARSAPSTLAQESSEALTPGEPGDGSENPESGSRKPASEQIKAISGLSAKFMQREWKKNSREVLFPCSNVGAVEFSFRKKAGDILLEDHGGGWLNVVTDTTADGGSRQWTVQNLYLSYRNTDELLGSKPVVDFSLGLDGETCIKNLKAAVLLSDKPIETELVALHLFSENVIQTPYLVGGRLDGGNAISDIPFTIGPWIGPVVVADRTARISLAVADIAEINEGHMGCAPAAAARSIAYLGETNDFETDDPQDIYDDLVEDMNTQISSTGTNDDDMLNGKNEYTSDNDLDIDAEILYTDTFDPAGGSDWEDLMEEVQDALDDGCDVEILISWSGGGGHVGMVTSVTSHADGSATIHYVDDPTQGDGTAENQEHVIAADAAGSFATGSVDGFMIQCFSE